MRVWSDSFRDGGLIPAGNSFAAIDPQTHTRPAANRNPHLAWDEVPNGTASLALFCHDADALPGGSGVNQEGVTLASDLPRVPFYHWCLLDIPPSLQQLEEGRYSDGVTARGKQTMMLDGAGPHMRQGLNDYTSYFANDPRMAGRYYGYDGPCPPWNDERIHHYIFRLYALDLPKLALDQQFTAAQARAALYGHILDEAQLVGAYSLHPALAATLTK